VVFVITGISLLFGAAWARIASIILAVVSAVGQLFLIPVQPWWSVIAVDVLVIYALTVHGGQLRDE
jgi:NADH:ubiquinone oxidoreductase subunit H